MAASVQDVYQACCYILLEDAGLVLGLLTQAQFIDILNDTLVEFHRETAINLDIWTQTVSADVGQYSIPTTTMRVDEAYLGGMLLEQSEVTDLNNTFPRWRYDEGPPTKAWHSDELPPETVEVVLKPNYNGAFLRGANFPAPPNGQYGSIANNGFGASVETSPGVFAIEAAPQHGGLTTIGPQMPTAITGLGSSFQMADDIALSCLAFGVLERVFSGDNELKDPQRALWCGNQYREISGILKSVTGEPDE